MSRGPLAEVGYRPQFSGHETFPLRHGWLTKSLRALLQAESAAQELRAVFTGGDAIARFGVGKNMVSSMRHWSEAVGVIDEEGPGATLRIAPLGRMLFGNDGVDRYMEHPTTLWLLHWQLAGHPRKTTWYWAFNHFASTTFEREGLVKALEQVVLESGWKRIAATTIRRDVDCFIRTYATRLVSNDAFDEDSLESPLTELGLLQQLGKRDGFRFVRNRKPSLSPAMFAYALTDFWLSRTSGRTLSLEMTTYEPGSPGRVFLLEEDDVAERLRQLEETWPQIFRWSETAGLRQIMVREGLQIDSAQEWLRRDLKAEAEHEET